MADDQKLMELEAKHQLVSMYMWLSQHFDKDRFPDAERAGVIASQIANTLATSLSSKSSPVPPRLSAGDATRGPWRWNRLSEGIERPKMTTRPASNQLRYIGRESKPQLRT